MDDLLRQLAAAINRAHRATAFSDHYYIDLEKQLQAILLQTHAAQYPLQQQVAQRIKRALKYYAGLPRSTTTEEEPNNAASLPVVGFEQLHLYQQPIEIVSGLLRHGELGILSGPPKARKTWLALDLALAIVLGGKWLGQFTCQRRRCLYVDMECHTGTIRNRLDLFRQHHRYNSIEIPAESLFFANMRSAPTASTAASAIAALTNTIFDKDIQFVIIDTISAFLPLENENDNAEVNAAMGRLLAAVTEAQVTCVIIHHTPKNAGLREVVDAAAGAGAFARKPDTVMAVTLDAVQPAEDGQLEEVATHIQFRCRSHAPLDRHRIDWLAAGSPPSPNVVPQAVHAPKVYTAPVRRKAAKAKDDLGSPAKKGSELDTAIEPNEYPC